LNLFTGLKNFKACALLTLTNYTTGGELSQAMAEIVQVQCLFT